MVNHANASRTNMERMRQIYQRFPKNRDYDTAAVFGGKNTNIQINIIDFKENLLNIDMISDANAQFRLHICSPNPKARNDTNNPEKFISQTNNETKHSRNQTNPEIQFSQKPLFKYNRLDTNSCYASNPELGPVLHQQPCPFNSTMLTTKYGSEYDLMSKDPLTPYNKVHMHRNKDTLNESQLTFINEQAQNNVLLDTHYTFGRPQRNDQT